MQWRSSQFSVYIAFAIALPSSVNGRSFGLRGESSRAPQGDDSTIEQLKAENEALMKRNKHLEAMMQVARSEVQRMDLQRKHAQYAPVGNVEVLNQEIADLKNKLEGVEADKKALVQTLRQMLSKNSTLAFKKQAEKAQQMKFALELKCGQERESLEKQLKQAQTSLQKKIEEAQGKCDDTKELAQTLQEQNLDLQKNVRDLQSQMAKSEQKDKELSADKANLVATMHSLMRETATFKEELEKQKATRAIEEKDLAADEAKIAKLMPKPKAKPKMTQSRRNSNYTFSHKHEESIASQMAHMKAINHYIIRSQEASAEDVGDDDLSFDAPLETAQDVPPTPSSDANDWRVVGRQMDEVQQREEKAKVQTPVRMEDANQQHAEKAKAQPSNRTEERSGVVAAAAAVSTKEEEGLREWLGLKTAGGSVPKDANGLSPIDALDPATVKQRQEEQKKVKKLAASKTHGESDDGGDGIDELLAQAKAQLKAMDDSDSPGSAAAISMP